MKLIIAALAACAGLTLMADPPRPVAVRTHRDRPTDRVMNSFGWSADPPETRIAFFLPADDNCCDCPPAATDQQCFAQCNALLPRCQAAAPPPSAQRAPSGCEVATHFCCAGSFRSPQRYAVCLGAPCRAIVPSGTLGGFQQWIAKTGIGCR